MTDLFNSTPLSLLIGYVLIIVAMLGLFLGRILSHRYNKYAEKNGVERLPKYNPFNTVDSMEFYRAVEKLKKIKIQDKGLRFLIVSCSIVGKAWLILITIFILSIAYSFYLLKFH